MLLSFPKTPSWLLLSGVCPVRTSSAFEVSAQMSLIRGRYESWNLLDHSPKLCCNGRPDATQQQQQYNG